MRRQISYHWRLRELMAEHGMFNTVELAPLLAERGITLSASQIHRLVTGTPERLSLPILAALCDIFDTTPDELITTSAENITRATADGTTFGAAGQEPLTDDSGSRTRGPHRPTRARIQPER